MLAAAFHSVPSFSPRAYLLPAGCLLQAPAPAPSPLHFRELPNLSRFLLTPEGECDMGSKTGRAQKALPNYF